MGEAPTSGMVVIGDEILSGRTRDANMHHLAGRLTEAGAPLAEVRVVADEHDLIVEAVQALSARHAYVFTSGGIGPTHDDITADAVAAAFGAAIDVREDARAILLARYGDESLLTEARLRMARIPQGASLIENPVSGAPGFRLGNVFVMAGVPSVFEAMVQSALPQIDGGPPVLSHALRLPVPEGDLAGPLKAVAQTHAQVSFGSYPFYAPPTVEGGRGAFGATVVARSADRAALSE
ncbi:MAG: molybdopterin-binding protein, partial [Pseudomonadota bacterium]